MKVKERDALRNYLDLVNAQNDDLQYELEEFLKTD